MLITKVKVGKVTNLSEARYCAGMGVDFLSFPISSIDPKLYKEITGWVAGPKFGIEVDSLEHEHGQYHSDFIQVTFDSLDKIQPGERAFVSLSVNEWFEAKKKLLSSKEKIIAIELSVHSLDDAKQLIEEIAKEFDVFLKYPFSTEIESILKLHITGISLEGNVETKPGLKEYPLAEILEKLEVAN